MNLVRFGDNNKRLDLTRNEYDALYILMDILKMDCIKKGDFRISSEEDERYRDLFYEYKNYSISEIIYIVKYLDISHELKELMMNREFIHNCLVILLMSGKIIINDGVGGEDTYRLVPRNLQDSAFTRSYYNFNFLYPDRVLLISDPHIGYLYYEDFDLIRNVFSYAKNEYYIDTAFLMGDVFHGVRFDKGPYKGYSYEDCEIQNILDNQLQSFIDYFPDDMKVISIEGNHDGSMIEYLKRIRYFSSPAARYYLSLLKPNFHMLNARENGYIINVSNMRISLSHPLKYNMFVPYVKTYEIEDSNSLLFPLRELNTEKVDLLLSGHFHFDMDFCIDDDNEITKRTIEVLPSLSKLALLTDDKCVAKILRFVYDSNRNVEYYGITDLLLEKGNIVEGEERLYLPNNEIRKEDNLREVVLRKKKDFRHLINKKRFINNLN